MTVPGRPVTFPKKDVQTGFRSTWNPSSSVPGWQSSLFSRPPALALLPLGSRVCFQFLPTLSPLHLCISCSLCLDALPCNVGKAHSSVLQKSLLQRSLLILPNQIDHLHQLLHPLFLYSVLSSSNHLSEPNMSSFYACLQPLSLQPSLK